MKNFRFKTLSLLLAGAALGMTSCQNEEILPNEGGGQGNGGELSSGKKVYVSAGISMPSAGGSRSATDGGSEGNQGETNSNANPDYEYGYDYENDVRTMILMFTTTSDQYLCYSVVTGLEKAPTGKNYEFEVLAELKYEDLQSAYNDQSNLLNTSQDVNVYAYCNYTADLEQKIESLTVGSTEWKDWTGNVTEAASLPGQTPTIVNTIWAPRAFLMTNYSKTETTFPETLEDWDEYADKSSPFKVTEGGEQSQDLKAIKVERSAARIDFKDGSPTSDQTYEILTDVHMIGEQDNEIETSTHNFFNVKLTRMSLVNMSKNFYYLRRVSNDGLNTGSTLLGIEGVSNYVVDTDAAEKQSKSIKTADGSAGDHFNFALYTKDEQDPNGTAYNREGWYSDNIEDVLKGTKDTWESTSGGAGQYRIWRYVTENTIPGAENQKTVQSTGVVFKGKLMVGKNIADTYDTEDELAKTERYISEEVEKALQNSEGKSESELPVLYSFDGFLYAGYEELIEKAAEDGKGGRLFTRIENILKSYKLNGNEYTTSGDGAVLDMETAYNIVTGKDSDHTIAMTDDDMVKVAATNGITVYKASDEEDGEGVGYYCYYFYWNRHNDNGKSGLMGPMEFATVRNNVYKLSVTKINQFGHPRIKAYDPDPEEEDRDDEDPLRYIEVHVDVLPWVVRENNIEF